MKTIVAPTDFSAASLNAVNYAADMACVTGCSLSLLYALPIMVAEVPMPVYGFDDNEKYEKEKIENLRHDLLLRIKDRIKIYTKVVTNDILSGITDFCSTVNPYAVVMGAETAGGLERLLGDAITTEAVKQLNWPVIVVPADAKFSNIRRVGLACDFRGVVDSIPFDEIRNIVEEFKAELHILHVNETTPENFSDGAVEESGWLQEMLYGLHPKYHFIKGSDIEKSIEEFADTNKLDMLIVIPKKHSLRHRIFNPSYSKQLVLHSHVPVMAVHEQGKS
jgi:nucleotide-binding universal stress UspA family protein